VASLLTGALLLAPHPSLAHPLGNFSVNHFSALEISPQLIRISYILDLAEIPTFREMQTYELVAQPDHPSAAAYQERKVQELQKGLFLLVGEQPLSLTLRSSALTFPPGAGGLPTLRISAVYEAPLEVANGRILYEDRNYPQRAGWKEIIATAQDGVTLSESSVPATSKSNQLTTYATDLLQAPPQDVQASLVFAASASARTFSSTSSFSASAS